MGWDYLDTTRPKSAKAYLDKEVQGIDAQRIVRASSLIGNEYYAAVETKTGEVFGLVVLLDRKDGQFGFKFMDESMGPYYHKCPEKILNLLSPTTCEYALAWREKCRKVIAQKNTMKNIKNGDVIQLPYTLGFGLFGKEDTFTVVKNGRTVQFRMQRSGLRCRIPNWKTLPFTTVKEITV